MHKDDKERMRRQSSDYKTSPLYLLSLFVFVKASKESFYFFLCKNKVKKRRKGESQKQERA